MWTRSLLKSNAKIVLGHHYWRSFLVCIVASFFLSSAVTVSGAGTQTAQSQDLIYTQLWEEYGFLFLGFTLIAFAAAVAFSFFISGAVEVGYNRYFMESRVGNAPFSSLFSVFGSPDYWNVVKIIFMRSVYIFLWSLLFLIPGIIKSLEYTAVPYILSENPGISAKRAFELSRQMTNGEKGAIFVLALSFIGWMMLGVLAFGIGVLFVEPYIQATYAELYAALRAKAFAAGFTDANELGDFVRY
ncbi:MAG: DUF975 family protein [Ruthenibacterium sp.]